MDLHNLALGDRVVIKRISDLTYRVLPEKKMGNRKITGFRKTQHPKVLSLFAGCGGLDLGFHKEGYKVKWANDNNEWAVKTFEDFFGKGIITDDDIRDIDPYLDTTIPDADIILGGFPCQDFSITWKQPGLNGERGNLYKKFVNFVNAKQPLAFVVENVKGLLTANKGKAITAVLNDFESIKPGYILYPKLYNFADYGVPQFRERLIIVGVRRDTGFDFSHPKPTHGPKGEKPYLTSGKAFLLPRPVEEIKENNVHMNIALKTKERLKKIGPGENFTAIPKDDPLYVKGLISHVYRRMDPSKPAMTVIAAGGGGTHGYHYPIPRAFTNRERARLQSFPDNFVFAGLPSEVRRQIGNAVPPEGVRSLARKLKDLFLKKYTPVNLEQKSLELKKMSIKERVEID